MVDLVVNVVFRLPKIVRGDFLVLTKDAVNATDDFEETDVLVIEASDGSTYNLEKEDGKVFIRPYVIVVGRFPDGSGGDADIPTGTGKLWVESDDGTAKTQEVPVRIVDPPPLSVKTVIKLGSETEHYTLGIFANPGVQGSGSTGNSSPFAADPIMARRSDFHRRVVKILETLFYQGEEVFRDEEIESHLRVFAIFDETLPADATNSLLRRTSGTTYIMEPRSKDLPNLLPTLLSNYDESADVVACVTADSTWNRCSAWFTTDDGSDTSYTYGGNNYSHGKATKTPGSYSDNILPYYNNDGDKMTTMHEFMHAMSERKARIIDLYNDGMFGGTGFEVDKKFRPSDPSGSVPGSNIPVNFGEYDGTTFKSDKPNPPYKGRGNIGYPGPENIRSTYGPELRNTANPNLMDNFPAGTSPSQAKLDKLTFGWVVKRIKAKIK